MNNNNNNNIVAVYIRVSTTDQTEFSPTAQLKAIKKFAKDNGYEIDSKYIYKDEGISGRKAEKRPAFMEMIKTAKTKPRSPFSKILVHKFDRFARNREDSVVYKSLLKKECNVDVISITETLSDDKFSVILEAMLEAMAEYYSLNLSDEVYKGMTEKAKRGEIQTGAPYGYKVIDGNFVIDESEARIVKYIYNEFDKGISFKQIVRNLSKLNIKTKKGNPFEVRRIDYILRNPTYKGYLLWAPGSKHNKENLDYRYENGIYEKGNFEPIIDEEQFDRIQLKIQKQKEKYKYIKKDIKQDWIRRLVKCSTCGGTLSVDHKGLQCANYNHGKCNESHYISLNVIKTAILNQIKKDIDYPLNINIIYQKDKDKENDLRQLLKDNLSKIDKKLERCKNLYIEGIDTIEEYKENKKAIEKEKKDILNQLSQLKEEKKDEVKDFTIKAKSVYELLTDDKISEDIKYTTIHNLIEKVIFNRKENTIEIFYKI